VNVLATLTSNGPASIRRLTLSKGGGLYSQHGIKTVGRELARGSEHVFLISIHNLVRAKTAHKGNAIIARGHGQHARAHAFGELHGQVTNAAAGAELPYPAIIEAIQHTRTRRTPVGRKNRFPDREHHHRAFGVILQNCLDCGRPPQANRSSWREQQNHAQLGRHSVEFRLQRGKRHTVHFHERWLTGRHVSRSGDVNAAENHHGRRKINRPGTLHWEFLVQTRQQLRKLLGKDKDGEHNGRRQSETHQT
jgi:hypothetical protein